MKLCGRSATTSVTRGRGKLARRQFRPHHVAQSCRGRRLGGLFVVIDLAPLDLFHRRTIAEADAPRVRADLDDLEVVLFARLERTSALQRAGRWTERRR